MIQDTAGVTGDASRADGGPDDRPGVRGDVAALFAVIAVGIGLSVLPHVDSWVRRGEAVWIADYDDLFYYLPIGAQAYDNHPARLGEPVRASGGTSVYPWLQMVPGILIARALNLGTAEINVAWRVLAGAGLGAGIYLLLRQYVRRPWMAAALAALLLADIGLISGWVFVKHYATLGKLLLGRDPELFRYAPVAFPQFRLITPGLSGPFLLMYLWTLARARARPTWPRIVLAGFGFGLLFHVYFFYWTAAGLGLALALLLDAGHRRVYFHVGWIGGLVGLPAVVSASLLKRSTSPDWLHRSDYFLPIARFSELSIPPKYVLLIAAGLAWAWFRRRDLLYLWALGAAGLLLRNHQVVTAMQCQNWHYEYVIGFAISLFVVIAALAPLVDRARLHRGVAAALLALCALQLGTGLWLRAAEAERTRYTREIRDDYRAYREQRGRPTAARLAPNSVVAGDWRFIEMATVVENVRPLDHPSIINTPSVDNAEWDERIALDGFLRGLGRRAFEAEQRGPILRGLETRAGAQGTYGPWVRDPAKFEERVAGRLAAFDAVVADPARQLDRFGVRYVILPADRAAPPYLGSGWTRIETGPTWQIWERGGRGPLAATSPGGRPEGPEARPAGADPRPRAPAPAR